MYEFFSQLAEKAAQVSQDKGNKLGKPGSESKKHITPEEDEKQSYEEKEGMDFLAIF